MDKKKVREFGAKSVLILVYDGRVIQCVYKEQKVLPHYGNFYNVLKKAIEKLSVKSPQNFERFYKSLNLDTPEYKQAKNIYAAKKLQERKA